MVMFVLALGACSAPSQKSAGQPVVWQGSAAWPVDLDRELEECEALVLVWWTPWCAPCAREAPALARAARGLHGRFSFVGVVAGGEQHASSSEVAAFVERHDLSYPTVRDHEGEMTRAFGVSSTPTIIVLGAGGRELFRGSSAPSWETIK
ncbi:MAG: hypothetical protein CMJ87_05525 [Planctomycetes bacterium]|nr:hypothetical protein [Planctomycetota bacterium]